MWYRGLRKAGGATGREEDRRRVFRRVEADFHRLGRAWDTETIAERRCRGIAVHDEPAGKARWRCRRLGIDEDEHRLDHVAVARELAHREGGVERSDSRTGEQATEKRSEVSGRTTDPDRHPVTWRNTRTQQPSSESTGGIPDLARGVRAALIDDGYVPRALARMGAHRVEQIE